MSNPSGTRFETDVVNRAKEHGWPEATRLPKQGAKDIGDLSIVPGFTLEAKATKALDVAGAVDQATVERENADMPYAAAIIKRRGKGTGQAYVVQELDQWLVRERAIADLATDRDRLTTTVDVIGMVLETMGAHLAVGEHAYTITFQQPDCTCDDCPECCGPDDGPEYDGPADDGPLPDRFCDPYDEGL